MKIWQEDLSLYISKVFVRPNLPFVLVGGLEGHLWALNNKGLTHTVEFPSKPEISHIETLANSNFILLAANNVLLSYNIITGDRKQLLVLDTKISCIAYDELREKIYIGLWSNANNKQTLLAFDYKNRVIGNLLWGVETGDIVRSIYIQEEHTIPYILVGSENKTVLCVDPNGNVVDKFLAPNRITKIRTYAKHSQTMVLVISDAAELLILKFEEKRLQLYKTIPLDARPGNAFLCVSNHMDYLVAITPLSISIYSKKDEEFELLWLGDGSKAHIKSLYWWPADICNRFIVERQDSVVACYEFRESNIETAMQAILESESSHNKKKFLGEILLTKERVYDVEYLSTKQTLFAVTGDSQLLKTRIDIKLSIPLTLRMCDVVFMYNFYGDRLRTVAILDDAGDDLVYLAGEKGIVYRYSTLHKTISSTPSLRGWIYDSVLIRLKNTYYLLVLCEKGLYLFDKNLVQIDALEIADDKFRCLHVDDVTNKMYVGSEAGIVYRLKPPVTSISGTEWEKNSREIISRAQGKIRNINSITASGKRLVVIGTEDGSIYAMDHSGNIVWSYLFGQWVRDFDIIRRNEKDTYIVVIGRQRYLDFIDTESGRLVHRHEIPYEPRSVRVFTYRGQIGMAATEIGSNLHLYTLSTKYKKIIVDPFEFPSRSIENAKSLITGKNILGLFAFLVGVIAFLANLAQIIDFIISLSAKWLGK